MYLLPAIDILDGRAVRLAKGDYSQVTVYNDDPVDQARKFESQGATWIHVVDLDGARTGVPENIAIVERIVRETSLSVEIGGGIRTLETLARLADIGAARMVLGTALVNDPDSRARRRGACRGRQTYRRHRREGRGSRRLRLDRGLGRCGMRSGPRDGQGGL